MFRKCTPEQLKQLHSRAGQLMGRPSDKDKTTSSPAPAAADAKRKRDTDTLTSMPKSAQRLFGAATSVPAPALAPAPSVPPPRAGLPSAAIRRTTTIPRPTAAQHTRPVESLFDQQDGSGDDGDVRPTPGQQKAVVSPFRKAGAAAPRTRNTPALWKQAQKVLRSQLISDTDTVEGLDDATREVRGILERVIKHRDNCTALLVGGPGTGKSLVVSHVLADIAKSHPSGTKPFLDVLLNGDVIADDNEAVRDLATQLSVSSAVLSRDAAALTSVEAGATYSTRHTSDEYSKFLTEILRESRAGSRPVIVVLDRFDQFAARHKQTFLYQLFDATQSRDVQLVVLGLTHRLDAVDMLEKRLKSRFSNRQIFFPPQPFDVVKKILKRKLTLPDTFDAQFAATWARTVDRMLSAPDVDAALNHASRLGRPITSIIRWLLQLISLSSSVAAITPELAMQQWKHVNRLPDMDALLNLSYVQYYVLVAIMQLESRDVKSYNFKQVHAEYKRFAANQAASHQGVDEPVVWKAFEDLIRLEILRWAKRDTEVRNSETEARKFEHVRMIVNPHELREHFEAGRIKCSSEIRQWAVEGN